MFPAKDQIRNGKREALEMIDEDSFEGTAVLYFLCLARKAGRIYRKYRDPSVIAKGVETWIALCGLSKTEAFHILKIVSSEISLQNSVVK